MSVKPFLEWIRLKESLHDNKHHPPYVSEGEIWWASIGENIGSEISGKSEVFSRPVIIYKKLSHSFYFVIPTTTKQKSGSWFATFKREEREFTACLHQARGIDYRRLYSKLATLEEEEFEKVKDGFRNLYQQKSSLPSPAGSRETPKVILL